MSESLESKTLLALIGDAKLDDSSLKALDEIGQDSDILEIIEQSFK